MYSIQKVIEMAHTQNIYEIKLKEVQCHVEGLQNINSDVCMLRTCKDERTHQPVLNRCATVSSSYMDGDAENALATHKSLTHSVCGYYVCNVHLHV